MIVIYVCGLIWHLCNFISYGLMYSSFVFYHSANGHKIGRNIEEVIMYINKFRYTYVH